MVTNFSVTSQSLWNDTQYSDTNNQTDFPIEYFWYETIIYPFIFLISLLGLLGNGSVIWLLGFHMKRNPFTICILNLAVTDFNVLIALTLESIGVILFIFTDYFAVFVLFASYISLIFMYNTGQLLLTAISIDRCVAVWFPIWHRCHRPPHLSTIVCALIWVLSLILCGIQVLVIITGHNPLVHGIVNVLICYPLMATSTLILSVKICCKQHKRKQTKTLTVILLALLFCLIFGILPNYSFIHVYTTTSYFISSGDSYFIYYITTFVMMIERTSIFDSISSLCICVNSSINPVLYFLAGRKRKILSRESMRVRLQRVFSDEEDHREEEGFPL
ncbi:mas-related G-protein coupled receptor member H-like [Elgaria multicarinata webbii]|uniref:mas-related G-protein coupled receptor member H-like n=1 Tax=Elgaria multicarinata webbii TaxID=159646 RepID=UPI002FCD3896